MQSTPAPIRRDAVMQTPRGSQVTGHVWWMFRYRVPYPHVYPRWTHQTIVKWHCTG
ncbi:hypothetical protein PATSB16_19840 [Pandoraea thiooxydans]|nr:hypothetical protein PATSB16_19840 [Pandoraea thiooxydans]